MTAPIKDKIIPVIFNLVNLSLKIITESKVIIDAMLAAINFKPEKKRNYNRQYRSIQNK